MNIKTCGPYAKHIALFAKLLLIPNIKVLSECNNKTDIELLGYYNRVSQIVRKETGYDIEGVLEKIPVFTYINFKEDVVIQCNSISECENDFINCISDIFDITPSCMIQNTIQHFIKRPCKHQELLYHICNNHNKQINVFSWICILLTCNETKTLGYRDTFIQIYKSLPKHNIRIAVIFCGFIRNYKLESHMSIINNPLVDIFIHTWDDTGFKNNARLINRLWLSDKNMNIDIDTIKKEYRPVKILVENNKSLLNSFSLVNKISPIFLYSGQAKDDATKYINSQLYSLKQGYNLICEYETENAMKYDAIIRLRFDFEIMYLDWPGILDDITRDVVYFPHSACNNHRHYGGGGGCMSCDKMISHKKHTNDICDIWFYGKRDLVCAICELYDMGLQIMIKNHEKNMEYFKNQTSYVIKDGFVYITSTKDIEEKYVAYYPERLIRECLMGVPCKSSKKLCGRI